MKALLASTTLLAFASAAQSADSDVFTLYRSSVAVNDARIHVATFDAALTADGSSAQYNLQNCQIAASLFREQPGVKVLYWCEPDRAPNALGIR